MDVIGRFGCYAYYLGKNILEQTFVILQSDDSVSDFLFPTPVFPAFKHLIVSAEQSNTRVRCNSKGIEFRIYSHTFKIGTVGRVECTCERIVVPNQNTVLIAGIQTFFIHIKASAPCSKHIHIGFFDKAYVFGK